MTRRRRALASLRVLPSRRVLSGARAGDARVIRSGVDTRAGAVAVAKERRLLP
ncbi:hypothetical protein [Streptomyces sp. NPDC001508]|uniref:hypothetical protein n=1 Tax=Streptomyces sp. NPDC001508 TaxID=3154656 RepID=UPI003327BBAC